MPKDEVALWDWLAALDDASRSAMHRSHSPDRKSENRRTDFGVQF
jgi:hypothetical protein